MTFMERSEEYNKFGNVIRGWNRVEMKYRGSWQRNGRLLVMILPAGKAGY
jgi:hypothetical protein